MKQDICGDFEKEKNVLFRYIRKCKERCINSYKSSNEFQFVLEVIKTYSSFCIIKWSIIYTSVKFNVRR